MHACLTTTAPRFRRPVGFDGFDRLFEMVNRFDDATTGGYPPYNLEKVGEDQYRIVMAVAGFGEDELTVAVDNGTLTIAGKARETQAPANGAETQSATVYLHRGIARRAFERRFELSDQVRVVGAGLDKGLLTVELVREVPEAKKPRTIKINGSGDAAAA